MKDRTNTIVMSILVALLLIFAAFFFATISIFTIKPANADSIICNDIIFTETSNVEVIPTDGENILKGTIVVKKIKFYGAGARISMHSDLDIVFNNMSQCMTIEDEVDSVKNLRWFLVKASAARLSRWNRKN